MGSYGYPINNSKWHIHLIKTHVLKSHNPFKIETKNPRFKMLKKHECQKCTENIQCHSSINFQWIVKLATSSHHSFAISCGWWPFSTMGIVPHVPPCPRTPRWSPIGLNPTLLFVQIDLIENGAPEKIGVGFQVLRCKTAENPRPCSHKARIFYNR